jgi:ribosomal protein S18 acetylase RimI-like enzyme
MKNWYSPKFNPAARFFPQIFSQEEIELVYRCLEATADKGTDNRATSTGNIDTSTSPIFLKSHQEAVLKTLETLEELPLSKREFIIERQIEKNLLIAKKKAMKWVEGKAKSEAEFTSWWKSVLPLPIGKLRAAVEKFKDENVQSRLYGQRAKSATVGSFSRDANNQWGRVSVEYPHQFSRVLPIIRRIDAAFEKALPERWALQKEFCEELDSRFVIEGTSFTTLTVNKNYRTAEHRDAGDLSQGFSNIAVFSNGRKFSGGHLVLPEFNAEVCLSPGDLLFVANHEYIHQNTAITNDDPESERLSIVAYAREDFSFCGTVEYEELRKRFQNEKKKFRNMWASEKWYAYLKKHFRSAGSFVDQARQNNGLNRETVLLNFLHESDPLWEGKNWEYVGVLPLTSRQDLTTLTAVFSAAHFRRPRQDVWMLDNRNEEGAEFVDAVFIHDGWCYGYAESNNGSVKFNNNHFNVQGIGCLQNFTLPIQKLPRQAFEWLTEKWEQSLNGKPLVVSLIRVATGIPEAPYRFAFTTLSRVEASKDSALAAMKKNGKYRERFYSTGGTLDIRDQFSTLPSNDWLIDLGTAFHQKRGGVLTTDGVAVCDSIGIRSATQLSYLQESLLHWRKRARNLGTDDYKSRYVRVGNYKAPQTTLSLTQKKSGDKTVPSVARPWHWTVTPTSANFKHYGWQENVRDTKRKVRAKTFVVTLEARGAQTKENWSTKYQSPLLLAAKVPPSATLAVWRLQNSKWNNGQAVLTDGDSFWLFQSLSTITPIRRGTEAERDRRVTVKVKSPAIITHLQRSGDQIQADKSRLIDWLRRNPVFIPTPFTELSPSLKGEYGSPYRSGRANVIAVGGPPASGKTTLMKKLFERADDWNRQNPVYKLPTKKGKVQSVSIPCYFSKKLNTWIIGVYDDRIGTFQGTDQANKRLGEALELFVKENANKPVNILFEGNNVVRVSTLTAIQKCDVNLVILRLMVSSKLKVERHKIRNDSQSEQFKKAKETQIRNVEREALLFDCVVQVRNETASDQQKIVKMVDWFTRRRQSDSVQIRERKTTLETISASEVQKLIEVWDQSESLRVLKQGQGLWGNFRYYESFSPVVLRDRRKVVAIAFRTLNRNGYFNLYEIAVDPRARGKGFGKQLWRLLIAHAYENGSTRLKMGCSPTSLGWHISNGALFWGVDEQGSLLCDIPLLPTVEQQVLLQKEGISNPIAVMPDEQVVKKLAAKGFVTIRNRLQLQKAIQAISQAGDCWLRGAICPDEKTPSLASLLPERTQNIHQVTKHQFVAAISDDVGDNFAKTFKARASAQNLWGDCFGYWKGEELLGAIITKYSSPTSKRSPKKANLTLLHTFAKHRNKGIGSKLVQDAIDKAIKKGCQYFRVSSEPEAVEFYRKLGFKFLGKQKSGSYVSMCRLNGNNIKNGTFDWSDEFIGDDLTKRARGAVQEKFAVPK